MDKEERFFELVEKLVVTAGDRIAQDKEFDDNEARQSIGGMAVVIKDLLTRYYVLMNDFNTMVNAKALYEVDMSRSMLQ